MLGHTMLCNHLPVVKGPIQPGYVCGRTQSAEYRLIEPIGSRGGEGWVWKAEYLNPNAVRRPNGLSAGDTIALKILNNEHHDDIEAFEQRWRRIADFYVGRDWHRNLVRIYEPPFRGKLPHHSDDYFEKGAETLYLPMEYLEGNSLRSHVTPERPKSAPPAPLPPLTVRKNYVAALEGIAEGLAELASVQGTENAGSVLSRRSGLIHRDVKPDNIIFPPGRAPVLVDFGSMREMFTSRMYSGISGTGGYMAPEVTDDSVDWALRATPAVDLYAFACVVYFTLSGKNPPSQQNSWQRHFDTFLDPAISEQTRKILLTVLGEEDPEVRLRLDVAQWSRAVTQSLNSGSGSSARISPAPTTPASNLNSPVTKPTTPDAPVTDPARPQTVAAAGRTQPPQRLSPTAPATASASKPNLKPESRDTQTSKTRVPQIENPGSKEYIYLKSQGKIRFLPEKVGAVGTLTSDNVTYQFVLTERHQQDRSDMQPGQVVHFRKTADGRAFPVSRYFERATVKGDPAYFAGSPMWPALVGPVLAALITVIVAVADTRELPWMLTILCATLNLFIVFVACVGMLVLREEKVPKFSYQTWWEDHHIYWALGLNLILMSCSVGAVVGPAHVLPLKTRYIAAWSELEGDGWHSAVLANLSLMAAIFLATSILSDLIWAVYSRRTRLPLGLRSAFVAKIVLVVAFATWLTQV